ncbi:hypothetical protein GIB67_025573 [Kingdonia uniflora]|uniref:Uncharacterized protein n=1 Tax=Kingdonia uniflora TaxID=39325 RepID=A0A7J7M0M7_9MAGN|nr:hypothetical protein GIB67_025573 [Kingdonia uniflora]
MTTISSVVLACAQLESREYADWIEDYIDNHGNRLINNRTVVALIEMHSKSGDPHKLILCLRSGRTKTLFVMLDDSRIRYARSRTRELLTADIRDSAMERLMQVLIGDLMGQGYSPGSDSDSDYEE